jgi:arylsulfatase A-like enzyme
MLGKWHLGDFASRPEFNPTSHGFDYFLGLPYSHDYRLPFVQDSPPVPLYRGRQEIERPVDASTLTQRYTQEAVRFIRESSGGPFFLYIAYNMPHLPVGVPASFQGRSRAGRYGDAIEEIDWSVGEVLDALKAANVDRNTVTVFFSDNGPWANATARSFQETQTLWDVGWAGLLRGTKGTTWEGGVRVPGIVRWPDGIPAARVSADMASELDLFPTLVRLAGGKVPDDSPDRWVRSHAATARPGSVTAARVVLLAGCGSGGGAPGRVETASRRAGRARRRDRISRCPRAVRSRPRPWRTPRCRTATPRGCRTPARASRILPGVDPLTSNALIRACPGHK